MSTAPAFLFDLDGTLADTLTDITASANHVRERHELPPVGPEAVRSWVGDGARMLLRRALAEVLHDADVVEARLDAAFAAYVEHHERQCTRTVALYPGAREFLSELHDAGQTIILVTHEDYIAKHALRAVRLMDGSIESDDAMGASTGGTR